MFDDNSYAIDAQNITVRYRLPHEQVSGLKEYAIRWLQRRLAYEEFLALNDVSFRIRHGETFGVIGRNGSGKSTLLKVIARVLFPPKGRIIIRGEVFPLLELGAGFHPELTGRENVFLNSALLGRSRAFAEQLLPSIVDFAEVGDFIDAPLRTYSTGMNGRLGFAVATCVRPDILLVDEVLSVGDAAFQKKCLDRMLAFRDQGTTVVIVSHSMTTIQSFCDRALFLNHGRVEAFGDTDEVIRRYIASHQEPESASPIVEEPLDTPLEQDGVALPVEILYYSHLTGLGCMYPAEGLLNIYHGTISVWLQFHPWDATTMPPVAAVFHTDDSRLVLYVIGTTDPKKRRVVARAVGNRRALNTFFGTAEFPELTTEISAAEDKPQWVHIVMSWDGYPEGKLRFYQNGQFLYELSYDQSFNNPHALPVQLAVGIRPLEWVGEIHQHEDGSVEVSRVETSMAAADAGVEIREMRLYCQVLADEQIAGIWRAGLAEEIAGRPA